MPRPEIPQRRIPQRRIPLRRPVAWLLDRCVAGYQRWISPLTPPACRYHPSCSVYARDALGQHSLPRAMWLTIWRILRCQPFSKGGFDPVPSGRYSATAAHRISHPHADEA